MGKEKDNNTALIVAGGLGIGYLLAPRALKEQFNLPDISFSLGDIGLGGLGELGGLGSLQSGPGNFEFPSFPEMPEFLPFPEIPEFPDFGEVFGSAIPTELPTPVQPALPGIVETILQNLVPGYGGKEPPRDSTLPVAPTPATLLSRYDKLHPVVQNVLAVGAGVAGVATTGVVGYATIKGIQTVGPATKTVWGALADTFKRFLEGGKQDVKAPGGKLPIPGGVNKKLWLQWLKRTTLTKGLKGVSMLGLAPLTFVEMWNEIDLSAGPGELKWNWKFWEAVDTEAGYIPAEGDIGRGIVTTYPEFSYERDRAPVLGQPYVSVEKGFIPPTTAYGGVEKGVTPPKQKKKVRVTGYRGMGDKEAPVIAVRTTGYRGMG